MPIMIWEQKEFKSQKVVLNIFTFRIKFYANLTQTFPVIEDATSVLELNCISEPTRFVTYTGSVSSISRPRLNFSFEFVVCLETNVLKLCFMYNQRLN